MRPETRVVDFAQLRVTALADPLRDLVDQIKLTNSHVERLTRDVGHVQADLNSVRSDLNQMRIEMNERFGRIDHQLIDVRGDVILQANQILSAQQSGRQALSRIQDLLERDGTESAE